MNKMGDRKKIDNKGEGRKQETLDDNQISQMIQKAAETKEEGTRLFVAGDFMSASSMYKKVVDLLGGLKGSEKTENERKRLLQAGLLNVAACMMKMGEWKAAHTHCTRVVEGDRLAVKGWYRRGECSLKLKDFTGASQDFKEVLVLEPNNKAARNKIVECEAAIKKVSEASKMFDDMLSGNQINDPGKAKSVINELLENRNAEVASIGGELPNFHVEYAKKYGRDNKFMLLFRAHLALAFDKDKSVDAIVQGEITDMSDPSIMAKRWGNYFEAAIKCENVMFGEIFPFNEKIQYGGAQHFQSMKNYKVVPWVLETGKTHVSLGCVDFSQLLFGMYVDGDSSDPTIFYGIDSSLVSIVRCKLLHRMLLKDAPARAVLQVWFSSGWSQLTLEEFLKAGRSLLEEGSLNQLEKTLVKHWIKNKVTLKAAVDGWTQGLQESIVKPYTPCANLRSEVDRVEYARYILTGYIFEEDEPSLVCGNRTMFSVPLSMGVSKTPDENFFYTLDIQGMANHGFEYVDSLKVSTDKFMMTKMDMVKEMIKQRKLKMTFETDVVTPDNTALLTKIKSLDPYTVDWSNLGDYVSKEKLLLMAQRCSGEETVHNLHLMNWFTRIVGTFILDYPKEMMKGIVEEHYKIWIDYHSMMLQMNPLYRTLWRNNTHFTSVKNLTMCMLAAEYKDKFLKDMFENLETNIQLRVYEVISYNPAVLHGAFTFADITLAWNLM